MTDSKPAVLDRDRLIRLVKELNALVHAQLAQVAALRAEVEAL